MTKVYVQTPLFSGWAEVEGYVPDDFYPISVILDEGDAEGHRKKRVSKSEIIKRKGDG